MTRKIIAKHLDGIGDLVVTARIKPGFIEAFEAVTYETRLRNVMKALFRLRSTAREYSLIKPFTDVAERIQTLLDYRLAIVDTQPTRTLVLTATFDRAWEPYMRLIWKPLGTFLDLLFCNCEDYPPAADNSFETFAAWVRANQISSDFFFATYGLSVGDLSYLGAAERAQREGGSDDPDLAACALLAPDPEASAAAVRNSTDDVVKLQYNDMAMEALVALHRLTDHYRADRLNGDGRYLHRAARDLLNGYDTAALAPPVRWRFAAQLEWFETPSEDPPASPKAEPLYDPADIQGGIIDRYDQPGQPLTHGALVLLQVVDAAAARQSIGALTVQSQADAAPGDGIFVNVAFSFSGLRTLGVTADELARFPPEFQEGMASRGGLIGDVRSSHARRWALPERWNPAGAIRGATPVDPSEIDMTIQLRTRREDYAGHEIAGHPDHPLFDRVVALAALPGFRLVAVEPMRRATLTPDNQDHFGFADNLSQPVVVETPCSSRDEVPRGEILYGYHNTRGDGPGERNPLIDNGSFLVVRKLSQDRPGLDALADAAVAANPGLDRETLFGKLVGRRRNGDPMLPGTTAASNEFDFSGDPTGAACPFQAHIRRANPRTTSFGRPTPRLMRRGMSFGPPVEAGPASRGIVFMAYNASIAEQYEVIQRWINGGNSTAVASCQNDPLMGVAQGGDDRVLRFAHDGKVVRLKLPEPFVKLMWGIYLFAPSISALQVIAGLSDPVRADGDVERGEAIIDELVALAAHDHEAAANRWKVILEDFLAKDPDEDATGPAVWAAIRTRHGGVLRVPYPVSVPGEAYPDGEAVLVGDKQLVLDVFADRDRYYSVAGYQQRLIRSIGPIYLGEDFDSPVSTFTNELLLGVGEQAAFKVARDISDKVLDTLLTGFAHFPPFERAGKVDLKREYYAPVLAEICRFWFGIPDAPQPTPGAPAPSNFHVEPGAWDWRAVSDRKPRCPADYMSPSRFVFYPDPVEAVQAYGEDHGAAMRAAVAALFAERRRSGDIVGSIMPAMFERITDDDELARTTIGVMTGFLPPTEAALRWAVYDWTENNELWRVQQQLAATPGEAFERAQALREPLIRTMQKRPAPDLLWRTATGAHSLGGVQVEPGDRVIIGISSATYADPQVDACPIFGGDKRAHQRAELHSHACPAEAFAMGSMLGILSALLERGRLQVLPAPLILKLTDRPPAAVPPPSGG